MGDVFFVGPSLVFVIYPEAIAEMPVPTLWALIFFFMLVMLGFSSLVNLTISKQALKEEILHQL